ncbi:lytic transglycosylase domain-containing protein [Calditrichota bacterium]
MKVKKYLHTVLILIIIFAAQTIYFEHSFSNHSEKLLQLQNSLNERIENLNYKLQEVEQDIALATKQSFVNSHKIPKYLSFCGDKINLNDPFVRESVEREFYSILSKQGQVQLYLKRMARYNKLIESHLKEAGLPLDLKYLAIHESALLPTIRSRSRAVGLWQFMSSTARLYHLKVNKYFDERRDPEKATPAAISYLSDLHDEFESWPLALAAYNGGPNRVKRAIRRENSRDFFSLDLPEETERYYFKIIATKIIISNPEKYGFKMEKSDFYYPHNTKKITFRVFEYRKSISEIADICNLTLSSFKALNPAFRSNSLPTGNYTLHIATDQYTACLENYQNYKNSFSVLAKVSDRDNQNVMVD